MQGIASVPFAGMGEGELSRLIDRGARVIPYSYVADFGGTAISAGGSRTERVVIQSDADFAVLRYAITARLDAADAAGALAGTPLPFRADPHDGTGGVNQIPTMELIRFQIEDNDLAWSNDPVRATHDGGNVAYPSIAFGYPIIGARNQLTVTVYNDAAVAVDAEVTFVGLKVFKRSR